MRDGKFQQKYKKFCEGKGYCGKCKVCTLFLSKREEQRYKILKTGYFPEIDDYSPLVRKEHHNGYTLVKFKDEIIGREKGDTTSLNYAAVLDIGTTTLVVSLLDVVKQKELGVFPLLNPQNRYGMDVILRIQKAQDKKILARMQKIILNATNKCISKLCSEKNIKKENIYSVVVAGNPTMIHIFLGISPVSIGVAPYTPAFKGEVEIYAKKINLNVSKFAKVWCLPNVSGYIGGDTIAGIVATSLNLKNKPSLFIDLGTNGEIVLSYKNKMIACSCAAGPAFEGVNISCGMIAKDGAIEKVVFENGKIKYKTIGGKKPIGICGSGIIDAVAELVRTKIIDKTGKFVKDENSKILAKRYKDYKFFLTPEIYISQKDIRNIQLAKSAISSAIKILLKKACVSWEDLEKIYIAGAFGENLNPKSLSLLGVIPSTVLNRIVVVGNTSLSGATLYLLSSSKRKDAENIANNIKCIDLFTHPEYEKLFVRELLFP